MPPCNRATFKSNRPEASTFILNHAFLAKSGTHLKEPIFFNILIFGVKGTHFPSFHKEINLKTYI